MKNISLIILSIIVPITLISCSKPTEVHNPLDGYYFNYASLTNVLPVSLVDTAGSFKVIIEREAEYEYQRNILEMAEACFPPENMILKISNMERTDFPQEESLWWGWTFDGVRLPFTVTGSSVEYYMQLIQLYREENFAEAGTIDMLSASIEYKASILYYDGFTHNGQTYNRVNVVTQQLIWENFCGMLCALGINKKRLVIFDAKTGHLLGVIGDGIPSIAVS